MGQDNSSKVSKLLHQGVPMKEASNGILNPSMDAQPLHIHKVPCFMWCCDSYLCFWMNSDVPLKCAKSVCIGMVQLENKSRNIDSSSDIDVDVGMGKSKFFKIFFLLTWSRKCIHGSNYLVFWTMTSPSASYPRPAQSVPQRPIGHFMVRETAIIQPL